MTFDTAAVMIHCLGGMVCLSLSGPDLPASARIVPPWSCGGSTERPGRGSDGVGLWPMVRCPCAIAMELPFNCCCHELRRAFLFVARRRAPMPVRGVSLGFLLTGAGRHGRALVCRRPRRFHRPGATLGRKRKWTALSQTAHAKCYFIFDSFSCGFVSQYSTKDAATGRTPPGLPPPMRLPESC